MAEVLTVVFYLLHMKNSFKIILGTLSIAILTASCGGNKSDEKTKSIQVTTPADTSNNKKIDSINARKKEEKVEAKFIINSLGEDETLTPITDVSVAFRDKIIYLSKIHGPVSELEKSKYGERDIPSNAIAACISWWAGSGTYYYIIPSKKGGIVIYQGWQDEEQTGYGYHWEKFKTISK